MEQFINDDELDAVLNIAVQVGMPEPVYELLCSILKMFGFDANTGSCH
jgi:hypothetical protein